MDFTNIRCISSTCKDKNIIMDGAGGSFGGRIETAKLRCPNCNLVLLIVPMEPKYEYKIEAITNKERTDSINKTKLKEIKLDTIKDILKTDLIVNEELKSLLTNLVLNI